MKGLRDNRFLRGVTLVLAFSAVVVVFSLEEALQTARALLGVAFVLAVAFFLFQVWRRRSSELDGWSASSRRVFYTAVALAVVTVGVYLGVEANGPESVAFVCVLAACVIAAVRTWRRERSLS